MRFYYVFIGAILELMQTRLFIAIFSVILTALIIALAFLVFRMAGKFRG